MKKSIVEMSSMKNDDLEFFDTITDLVIKCNRILRYANVKIFYCVFDGLDA